MNNKNSLNNTSLIKNVVQSADLNDNDKDELLNTLASIQGDKCMMDRIFGREHPEKYIAFVVMVMLLICGGICTVLFKNDSEFVKGIWQIFIPAITLIIGYLLGKN